MGEHTYIRVISKSFFMRPLGHKPSTTSLNNHSLDKTSIGENILEPNFTAAPPSNQTSDIHKNHPCSLLPRAMLFANLCNFGLSKIVQVRPECLCLCNSNAGLMDLPSHDRQEYRAPLYFLLNASIRSHQTQHVT